MSPLSKGGRCRGAAYLYLHVWPARGNVKACQLFMEVTRHKLCRHKEPYGLDVSLQGGWYCLQPASNKESVALGQL